MSLLQKGSRPDKALRPRILELPLVWNTDLNQVLGEGNRAGRFEIALRDTPCHSVNVGVPRLVTSQSTSQSADSTLGHGPEGS